MEQILKDNALFPMEQLHGRGLQFQVPDYTSPPTELALQATPEAYRSDEVIDQHRDMAAAGNCTTEEGSRCHIPFPPAAGFETSKVGVVFYGGGLVDPRGYSPLVELLATRYGFPTVVPIFNDDLAFVFGVCDSGRVDIARAEFPEVEKWVLAGHSFGGVAAVADMWSRYQSGDDDVAGLVTVAADVTNTLGCGDTNFSDSNLPMAAVTAELDLVLNMTRWELNKPLMSKQTQFVDILGGNHGGFGSYNDTERFELFGQIDGTPLVGPEIQWDFTAAAIAHVASRTDMPIRTPPISASITSAPITMSPATSTPSTSGSFVASHFSSTCVSLLLLGWLLKRN
mmetsp:Transcript_17059/g.25828  ORF Transcript_17059/g.25828 Transcript_17059/m.25828 type:complete len:341 (+) Transcript_17059:112-1134(+)|eukprot:CAMPEP_0178900514 /NCGR_PEP_ID=MMETSP0786-20121207/3515_1 /TAXON_ID=186022 /ORGANISM="Thalassionema frauenfeldii, Strain CCMP 1798" /LENGTH=340 /DNA_ID=CAMNT_0020571525 /DNA_START=61 /DNA_END=1083 /DNA_ORIENTATION=-